MNRMALGALAIAGVIAGGGAQASSCLPYQAVMGETRIAFGPVYTLCPSNGSFDEWQDAKAYLLARQNSIDTREAAAVACHGRAADGTLPSDDEIKECLAKAGHDYPIPAPTPEANKLLDLYGLATQTR